MGSLGFWRLAQRDPDWIAAVDPDGTEHTAGELLARANRTVHGLRALGLEPGDGICGLVPNGTDGLVLYLAALQAGWYYTPINWHLTGPEIGYIVADSEAKAFFVDERFAAGAVGADEAKLDPRRRFAFGPGGRSGSVGRAEPGGRSGSVGREEPVNCAANSPSPAPTSSMLRPQCGAMRSYW
jgi:long-chain acyl-CoA synthetase